MFAISSLLMKPKMISDPFKMAGFDPPLSGWF